MSDALGTETIPLVAAESGYAAGDAGLTHLLNFLYAFLQTDGNATAAWQATGIAPSVPAVRFVRAHDPRKRAFNSNDLPALYAFRDGTTEETEQAGDDWLVSRGTITLLWVFPPRPQDVQVDRDPYVNGLAKCIERAIHHGRTPSFAIAGDTDRGATTEGSLLWGTSAMRLYGFPSVRRWKPSTVKVPTADREEGTYDALEVTIAIAEALEVDVTAYDLNAGGMQMQILDGSGRVAQTALFLASYENIEWSGRWGAARAIRSAGTDQYDAEVATWTAYDGPNGVAGAAVSGTSVTNDYPTVGIECDAGPETLPTIAFAGGLTSSAPTYLFDAFDLGPMSALFTSSAFVMFLVMRAHVVYPDPVEIYNGQGVVTDSEGYLGLIARGGYDGPTLTLYHYDNPTTATEIDAAIRLGAWHVVEARHESGRTFLRVDDGVEQQATSGTTDAFTGRLLVGRNGGAYKGFDGQVGELMVKASMTREQREATRADLMRRWGIRR